MMIKVHCQHVMCSDDLAVECEHQKGSDNGAIGKKI